MTGREFLLFVVPVSAVVIAAVWAIIAKCKVHGVYAFLLILGAVCILIGCFIITIKWDMSHPVLIPTYHSSTPEVTPSSASLASPSNPATAVTTTLAPSLVPTIDPNKRFDILDETEINKRIDAINLELNGEDLYIKPDVFKKMIYGFNGNYTNLTSAFTDMIEPLSIISNVDLKVACNMPLLKDPQLSKGLLKDKRTPLSHLSDIFVDTREYAFVDTFMRKREKIYDISYETKDMKIVRPYVDDYFVNFAKVIEGQSIETKIGDINPKSINKEAMLFIILMNAPMMQIAMNYGENYSVKVNDIGISIQVLNDSIEQEKKEIEIEIGYRIEENK